MPPLGHKSPAAEEKARQQQKRLAALSKRKIQEQQAVSLRSPSPEFLSKKKTKRSRSASFISASKVLKPHPTGPTAGVTTKTPTRPPKTPRSVTPAQPSAGVASPSINNTTESDEDTVVATETCFDTDTLAESFFTPENGIEVGPQEEFTLDDDDSTVPEDTDNMAPTKVNQRAQADITIYALNKLKKELSELKEENGHLQLQLGNQGKELSDVSGQYEKLKLELEKLRKRNSNCGGVSIDDYNAVKNDLDKVTKEYKSSKQAYDTLLKKHEGRKKVISDLKQRVQELEATVSRTQEGDGEELPRDMKDLMKELSEEKAKNLTLEKDVDRLKATVADCLSELRKKNKALKFEVAKEVLDPAKDAVKELVWRTTKLISSKKDTEVEGMTKTVYNAIKDARGFEDKESPDDYLTYEEFHRIYKDELLKYFNQIRQQTQTACQSAVLGTHIRIQSQRTLLHS